MIEKITAYTKGIYEPSKQEIALSKEEITHVLYAGESAEGLITIFGLTPGKLKGLALSDDPIVSFDKDRYVSVNATESDRIDARNCGINREPRYVAKINYKISCELFEAGEELKGEIKLVTSAGEITVPYQVVIVKPLGSTYAASIPEVIGLSDFAELAKRDWDSAYSIFINEESFASLLEGDDKKKTLYDGFMYSLDKQAAMEGFLEAMDLKSEIGISLFEEEKHYESILTDTNLQVRIFKNNWGYMSLRFYTNEPFIVLQRNGVATTDFIANSYDLGFRINADALHNGKNYGSIIIETEKERIEYKIIIDNRIKPKIASYNPKDDAFKIANSYVLYRAGKIDATEWANRSLRYLNSVSGVDDDSLWKMLHKAYIYVETGRIDEASAVLRFVAEYILGDEAEKNQLFAYYLFVRCLEKNDPDYTREAIKKIKLAYSRDNSWRILWVLINLDDRYILNPEYAFGEIKNQFYLGCSSPVLYLDALKAVIKEPHLIGPESLRVHPADPLRGAYGFSSFEYQILSFGCKWNLLTEELIKYISQLAEELRDYNEKLTGLLMKVYDDVHIPELLSAICVQLIKGNVTSLLALTYYEEATALGLNIINLYEYYVHATHDYRSQIPEKVLMYFSYSSASLHDDQAKLFANIITYKEMMPNVYRDFIPAIKKYATQAISSGKISAELVVIYEDLLKDEILEAGDWTGVFRLLNTYHLQIQDNLGIAEKDREAFAFYKGFDNPLPVRIRGGEAYIVSYKNEPVVLIRDNWGNMIMPGRNATLNHLVSDPLALKRCFYLVNENLEGVDDYMLAAFPVEFLRHARDKKQALYRLEALLIKGGLKEWAKKQIVKEIIDYYYEYYDEDSLAVALEIIGQFSASRAARLKILELSVLTGKFEGVVYDLYRTSFKGLSPVVAQKIVARALALGEQDNPKEKQMLLKLAGYAARNDCFDEVQLRFLIENYIGTLDEQVKLCAAGEKHGLDCKDVLEGIVVQSVFTSEGGHFEHFEKYYSMNPDRDVVLAYLTFCSKKYFIDGQEAPDRLFSIIDSEIREGVKIPLVCKAAYVLYISRNAGIITENSSFSFASLQRTMVDLSIAGIIFEEMLSLADKAGIVISVRNAYVVSVRSLVSDEVFIKYSVDSSNGGEINIVKKLPSVIRGFYSAEMFAFYGDVINYEIYSSSDGPNPDPSKKKVLASEEGVIFSNATINGSIYGMLNGIIRNGDTGTLKEEYLIRKKATELYFGVEE